MMSRIYLALNAIAIGFVGLAYLADPNLLLARYGLETGSAGMDSMLRSAYGGVFLASAGLFLLGVFDERRRRDIVGFTTLFMAGAALGRLVSLILAGPAPASIIPLLASEITMAALGLFLFLRSKQPV